MPTSAMWVLKILIVFMILSGCSAAKKQNRLYEKITGISPTYVKTDSSVFTINAGDLQIPNLGFVYLDSFVTGPVLDFTLKEDGSVPVFFKSPTFITQMDNTKNIFYVYPNCRLKATQNKNGYIEFIDLNGSEEKNNEINFFQKLTYETGRFNGGLPGAYRYVDSSKYSINLFEELESEFHKLKNARLHFLDSFTTVSHVSNRFKEIAISIINYVCIQDSLLLSYRFKDILIKKNLYQNTLYKTLNSINHLNSFTDQYFATLCLTMLNLLENKEPQKSIIHSENEFYANVDTIKKYFKALSKDYLLADQYIKASKKYDVSDAYFVSMLQNINDAGFKNLVLKAHDKKQLLQESINNSKADNLLGLKGKTISIDALLEKYKGKLILVDFWASWCEPCRKNMPFSRRLENEFKNKKIAFVYISLDINQMNWKVASISENLEVNNSFKLVDLKNSPFKKVHNIEEIPRYMLFDKAGNIINEQAPDPGDLKLKELIEENLKE